MFFSLQFNGCQDLKESQAAGAIIMPAVLCEDCQDRDS